MWAIIAFGATASLFSAFSLSSVTLDIRFWFLAFITIFIGSRITIKIPRITGHISVSDTFIFLIILLFGGELATMVAAAEALCSSLRFSKKRLTIAFNAATAASSTFITFWTLRLCFGAITDLREGYSAPFIIAICTMALVQYVCNSGMVATAAALKSGQSLWLTWHKGFLWTSITYFAGASAAGIIAKLIDAAGFYAFLATTPIIVIVYFTYSTYLKNVEASFAQAEQAERHVEALKESEERFIKAFNASPAPMTISQYEDGRYLYVNDSYLRITGYGRDEIIGHNTSELNLWADPSVGQRLVKMLEHEGRIHEEEVTFRLKSGEIRTGLFSAEIIDVGGEHCILTTTIDITDRKRAEERLLHEAFHDVLTGLPNRALFVDHLKLSVERVKRREDRLFAVLFLDLDRFKIINDSLGHMVGDQLLVGIARRLEICLRPGDTVARMGGDEFTILLEDLTHVTEAIEVAERLQKALALPFNLNGHEVFTTVSIGIALSTTGYDRSEEVLRDADTAMYRAKMLGKARHEVFDKTMHARAMQILQLETDLRRALERNEFVLHYQPIVALETGTIRGFEALIRWQHPERGFISPDDFIPIAEETGLIVPIGQWVIEEACRQIRRWQDEFPQYPPLQISVNLSSKQFINSDLIAQIRQALRETGLDAHSLKLEITESMVMENVEVATDMLQQLRNLGIELSIDDFGTGYSSLSYLHRFPISTLKIDRSFVSSMTGNNENAEIVRTIMMLARSLKLDVVAEGVETQDQLSQLAALECEYGQGYFFSKPLNAEAASRLLAEHRIYQINLAPLNEFIQEESLLVA